MSTRFRSTTIVLYVEKTWNSCANWYKYITLYQHILGFWDLQGLHCAMHRAPHIYEAFLKAPAQHWHTHTHSSLTTKARFGWSSALSSFCHHISRVTSLLVKSRRKLVCMDEVNNCGMAFWHARKVKLHCYRRPATCLVAAVDKVTDVSRG